MRIDAMTDSEMAWLRARTGYCEAARQYPYRARIQFHNSEHEWDWYFRSLADRDEFMRTFAPFAVIRKGGKTL